MQISRQVILDEAINQISEALDDFQKNKSLNDGDMENILTHLLLRYKNKKEAEYSTVILNLMTQVQQLEAEKKKVKEPETK